MAEPIIRFKENNGCEYSDWIECQLQDIVERITRKNKNNETDIPLTISSLGGLVDQRTYFGKTIASRDMSGYYLLQNGEFAYNKSYSVGFDFGSIKRLDKYDQGALSTLYICFALKDKSISDYMTHYFNSLVWNKEMPKICAEGARNHGLLNVSAADFFKININMPASAEEREKIVSLLNEVELLVSTLTEEVRLWEENKKGVMQKIFSQEVRFKDENDNDYPEWKEKKFSDITFAAGQRNKKNLQLEPYAITNISGFIAQKEAHDDFAYMKNADKSAYIVVSPNSFGYNPARINVGSLGYYSGEERVIVSSLYEVFKTTDNVHDAFLTQWFKTEEFQRWIQKLQEGSVRLYFYYDKLCESKIMLPCLAEQQKISDCLASIDEVIELKKQKVEIWKNIKKGLLQQMFV